jgi:hypothetical protein
MTIDEAVRESERVKYWRKENDRRVLAEMKKRGKKPRSFQTIGSFAGVNGYAMPGVMARLKKRGLVRFVPAKSCPHCKTLLVSTAGWIYTGPKK